MDLLFGESDRDRERGERDREFIGLRETDRRRERDRSFLKIGDTERFGERDRDIDGNAEMLTENENAHVDVILEAASKEKK